MNFKLGKFPISDGISSVEDIFGKYLINNNNNNN